LMIDHARAGKDVGAAEVGDPFILDAGGKEEVEAIVGCGTGVRSSSAFLR